MKVRMMIFLGMAVSSAFGATGDGAGWTIIASNDFHHVIVRNANAQRSAEGVVCKWTVLRNGEPSAADSFDLRGMLPGQSLSYAVPEAFQQARERGDKASLRLRFIEAPETELVRCQLDAPDGTFVGYRPIAGEALELTEEGQSLVFVIGDMTVTFSKQTGLLTGFRRKGFFSDDVLVAEPIRLVVAEAPKLSFAWTLEKISPVDLLPSQAHFSALVRAIAPEMNAMLELDWTVFCDGAVRCLCRLRPAIGKTLPADVGLRVASGADSPEIDYFAIDGLLGRHSAEAEALMTRQASIRGARALEVKDGSALLGLAAVGRPFAFSVDRNKTVGVCIFPDGDIDSCRPRQLDFMIGPRRFANVVGAN